MRIERIDPESFSQSVWSGGKTTELYIFPEGASYALRRFDFRISSATVDADESIFTPLPGVMRYITPLSEGFELTVGEASSRFLKRGETLRFMGSERTVCRGRGRDLNLMLSGLPGALGVLRANTAVTLEKRGFIFVYSDEASTLTFPGGEAKLSRRGLARLYADGGERVKPSGDVIVITVE